jgi:hypothetical protein
MQLYDIFTEYSAPSKKFVCLLKHFPCDVHENHNVSFAEKEQNCSASWLDFPYSWLQSLAGRQFSVLELCEDFSETACS